MVNPLVYWRRVPLCTRSWIPLMGLSKSLGIWLLIPLRGLSVFWVPPGLLVPSHTLLVPVFRSFQFFVFYLFWHIWVSLLYGSISGGFLWHSMTGISFPLPRICGKDFFILCLWPNKISYLLLWTFFILLFHQWLCLIMYCLLLLVLVVVGGTFMPGRSNGCPFLVIFK